MNDQSAGPVDLPRTAYLDHTLRRARTAAEQRSHRYVTLEHLLLALLDDPDAVQLLKSAGADIAVIRSAVADIVNHRMASLVVPDGRAPNFSYKFDSLFSGASQDAVRAGRREVDGAFALVAVAKEVDSGASAILAANGFTPQVALQFIGQPLQPPQQRPAPPAGTVQKPPQPQNAPRPNPPAPAVPPPASLAVSMTSGEESMEDMLTSVRNILEAEERKERGIPGNRAPPPRAAQPRVEPQLGASSVPERAMPRLAAPPQPQLPREPIEKSNRVEPSLGQPPPSRLPPRPRVPPIPGGFAEPPPPGFDLEKPAAPPPAKAGKRAGQGGSAQRGKTATSPLVVKILERIPRKASVAVPETIEVLISKEEAGIVFGWLSRRGQPQQGAEAPAACRAVTVRLSAPEGGFFIEGITPETQWLLDRPAFLGEEAFGTWAWTVIPNDSGTFVLTVSMSARDVDANGLAGDHKVPDQVIKVRVRGNLWRGLGSLVSTLLIFLAGSGLTVAASYVLKMMGKLPH